MSIQSDVLTNQKRIKKCFNLPIVNVANHKYAYSSVYFLHIYDYKLN